MKAILTACLVIAILSLHCSEGTFIKYNEGLAYKIFSYRQADLVRPGETLKLHIRQVYHDSVLSNTRESLPFYQVYDSLKMSRESYHIFGQMRKGDSVVFKALADSAFKGALPPFAKKGGFLFTHVVVEDILGVKEDLRADLAREMERRKKIRY